MLLLLLLLPLLLQRQQQQQLLLLLLLLLFLFVFNRSAFLALIFIRLCPLFVVHPAVWKCWGNGKWDIFCTEVGEISWLLHYCYSIFNNYVLVIVRKQRTYVWILLKWYVTEQRSADWERHWLPKHNGQHLLCHDWQSVSFTYFVHFPCAIICCFSFLLHSRKVTNDSVCFLTVTWFLFNHPIFP